MVRKHGDASPQPGEAMSWSRPRRLGDGVNIAARLIGILLRRMSLELVESRCGAVALGRTYLLPPLSSGGASMVPPWLRFHIPLIEPDRQISRIRLSDKTSRFRVQRPLQLLNIYWSC